MTTTRQWFLERLKADWPTLYEAMEQTVIFGIPVSIRFADWIVLHFFTMRNELIDEACKEVRAQFGKTPVAETVCEFLARNREKLG